MQLLRFKAKQNPEFDHAKRHAGAYVDCFIKDQTKQNAFYIARCSIADNGWYIVEIEDQHDIDESSFESDPEGLSYFHQALVEGEVYVYFTFEEDEENTEA